MATLSTKLLPDGVLNVIKHTRPVYTVARKFRFAVGSWLGARPVVGLCGRVHYNDFMLSSINDGDVRAYRDGAQQFVDALSRALQRVDRTWDEVHAALEIGCGYGRIVRELRQRLLAERIYVTDLIDEGARFTAAEFRTHRIPVIEQAGAEWNGRFDLIYLLSVYTHLRRDLIVANLRRVEELLKPEGIVAFTIHGQGSADRAEIYRQYWLNKNVLTDSLRREGYYYGRYPYYNFDYGLTWFTKEAIDATLAEAAPRLQAVSYEPMAIDEHQDLFVYRKSEE